MSGDGGNWNIGDWHIPTVVAAFAWLASALAVLGYTVIAFKETAGGKDSLDSSPPGQGPVVDPGLNPNVKGPIDPRKYPFDPALNPDVKGPIDPRKHPYKVFPKSGSAPK